MLSSSHTRRLTLLATHLKPTALSSTASSFTAPRRAMSSQLQVVHTEDAPAAIGPYSQAIAANGFLYCSGQVPLDPKTGDVVPGGVREQTEQVFRNINAVLRAANIDLTRVCKTTVFLKDMNQFADFNEVYAKEMGNHRPARSAFEVARLPRDVLVEIECIALLN